MSYFVGELGLKYHYEIRSAAMPFDVAFIHGNLASRRWWYPMAEHLPKLHSRPTQGRLIFLEFLGCGLSEAPRQPSDVDMPLFARDFDALLRSIDFHGGVVGHSTGGLIAALMLSLGSKIYKGGFLLDPVGAKGVTFDDSMTAAFEAMKQDKNLTATVIGSTIHGLDPKHPFFQEVIVEDAFLAVKQVGAWVLQALAGLDIQEDLKKVDVPVWVTHGEFDQLLPKSDSQAMAALMARARFFEIPGAGHCLNYENPKEMAEWVLRWSEAL
ncbi:MAG: alpha/beta hydrolase [Bdellovibrionaceae bacterium]|nr:alpha/beta hydrolase [Pseudobdellovibrionaceae bacterium]